MAITYSEHFLPNYTSGTILFFAGSGISYASKLPSAPQVLRSTIRATMPTAPKSEIEELLKLQPEVFYETLLAFDSPEKILHLWKILHPSVQRTFGIPSEGNIVHKALVRYSAKFGVPILTTNFDTLFEAAAIEDGIDYNVLLPKDPPPSYLKIGKAIICKLHGSIGDIGGLPKFDSLRTTMTDITKTNTPWVEYIESIMEAFHICFVGYSGRDIDLFPFIEAASKRLVSKQPIWINKCFSGDPADVPSTRCGSTRLYGLHPSELLAEIHKDWNHTQGSSLAGAKNDALLQQLEREQRDLLQFNDRTQRLLRTLLLARSGAYTRAYEMAFPGEPEIDNPMYGRYLLMKSRLCHEVSSYRRSYFLAKVAYTWARSQAEPVRSNVLIQASCLMEEAKRVDIPFDTYFQESISKKIVPTTLLLVTSLYTWFICSVRAFSLKRREELENESIHAIIEHKIRLLSVLQGPTLVIPGKWRSIPTLILKSSWKKLVKQSKKQGYAEGIANCNKFASRLPLNIREESDDSVYRLLSSNTGLELTFRNEANAELETGNHQAAKEKFELMIRSSRESGNRLNEIKGLLGFAMANIASGGVPPLSASQLDRFDGLIDELDSDNWRKHLLEIRNKFLIGGST